MQKLTESAVTRLTVKPGEREAYAWDPSLPGFGCRAFASGAKSWVVKYQLPDGRQRKMSLGAVQSGMLNEARKAAASILLKAKNGQDPAAEKQAAKERAKRERPTGDLIRDYLAMKKTEVRASTFREIERHLDTLMAPLHLLSIDAVGHRDVVAVIDELSKLGKRVQADRCKSSAVGFFNWAVERDYLQANPAAGISRRTPAEAIERDRVLSMDELAMVWRATDGHTDYEKIVRLLALTGARADEIACLAWNEVDFDKAEICLPPERMKNRRAHRIFLSGPAVQILKNITRRPKKPHVFGQTQSGPFSGWSKAKTRLDEKLNKVVRLATKDEAVFKAWRHHDLRRSLATNAADLGLTSTVVIEMALGHWSGEKRGIVKTYNKSTHDFERRKLMDDWADAMLKAAGARQ
jgi:integrase